MKYFLLLLSLTILASCSRSGTTEIPTVPTPTPTDTQVQTPVPVETQSVAPISEVTLPPASQESAIAKDPSDPTYYDDLKARCNNLTDTEKKSGCLASVTIMQDNGYKEVEYNAAGEAYPCTEGLQKNTTRSPGSIAWCAPIPQ